MNNIELYYKISDKFKKLMKDILIDKVNIDEDLLSSFNKLSENIQNNINNEESLKDLLKEYNKIFNEIYINYKLKCENDK